MKRYELSWFNDFECLCGDCPESCCRGWVIPLSERDVERLKKERGWLGLIMFYATDGWTGAKFNSRSGSCPFHQRDGLCRLQRQKGHDFIPWTCQSYPRFYRNYQNFEEACLDLSCPGAARLFIKNNGSLDMKECDGEPVTMPCTTNDDEDLFAALLDDRHKMTAAASKGLSGKLSDTLFEYAVMLQEHFANGNTTMPERSFASFINDRTEDRSFSFPIPADVLPGFLGTSLCHFRLRKVSPKLYRMFNTASSYLKRIKKTDYPEKACAFLEENPFIKKTLGNYLAYYLFQYYLRTFETYSFRRQLALGIIHTNMILLLAMTHEGDVDEEALAMIISVYNRRAFFNDTIQDEMYRIFESYYKKITQR